jgi:hypothetical protein
MGYPGSAGRDIGKRMGIRHGWLFPLMVLAAGAVTAFGCVGIAAIIGYLPLLPPAAPPGAMQAIAGLPLTASEPGLTQAPRAARPEARE